MLNAHCGSLLLSSHTGQIFSWILGSFGNLSLVFLTNSLGWVHQYPLAHVVILSQIKMLCFAYRWEGVAPPCQMSKGSELQLCTASWLALRQAGGLSTSRSNLNQIGFLSLRLHLIGKWWDLAAPSSPDKPPLLI